MKRFMVAVQVILLLSAARTVAQTFSVTVVPNLDTLPAGTTQTFTASVIKSDNTVCDACAQNVHWTLTANPPTSVSTLLPAVGPTSTFTAIDAYTRYFITATFDSTPPTGPSIHLSWRDTIYVKPGPATHLNIEPVSDSTASLLNDNLFPAHSLTMPGTTLKDSVYAVLRDAYGNWVSHATLASWLSRDLTVVTAATTSRTQLGEGEITRVATTSVNTIVRASQLVGSVTLADSISVNVSKILYSQVQIYVLSGGINPIDSLFMRTDQDTTLFARGLRADGSGIWDYNLLVKWGNSAGLTFNNAAPAAGQSWTFNPQAPATGTIFIDYTSNATVLRDTVKVVFVSGLPFKEALYPLPGQPMATAPNAPLAASATVVAGVPFQIVAKLFDNKNLWLSSYERANSPITWTVQELSGSDLTGSLSPASGYLTSFTGRKAGNVVKITATYIQEPGNSNVVTPQGITFTVVSASATHLVIEGDTSRARSPNVDNPLQTITIGGSDTSVRVYAILRDTYGNWMDYSKTTLWSSVDITQAIAVSGSTDIGQGIITRKTASGQTIVIARDTTHTGAGFTDSVTVVLSSFSNVKRLCPGAQRPVIPKLSIIFLNVQSYTFPLSQNIVHSNLSFSLYDLSGRAVCRINGLDITKPIVLNSSIRPGVCCMRLSADGKTILQHRLLFAK